MGGLCRCMIYSCCCVGVMFGVTFAFGILVSWISVRTAKSGATYVQSFYVPALNKTTGNNITGNTTSINFVLYFVNPYEYMGIYYDDLNFTFYYGSSQSLAIGSYSDVGFYQNPHDTTYWRDHFETTRGILWDVVVPQNGSMVAFRVDLVTRVRYSELFLKSKWRVLRVGAVVQVNDTTGLKVKKKSIKLKSAAPKLHGFGMPVRLLIMVLLAGYSSISIYT